MTLRYVNNVQTTKLTLLQYPAYHVCYHPLSLPPLSPGTSFCDLAPVAVYRWVGRWASSDVLVSNVSASGPGKSGSSGYDRWVIVTIGSELRSCNRLQLLEGDRCGASWSERGVS